MFTDGFLEGKSVLVTGGGTGLGFSMASYFAELGAHVSIMGRRGEVLQKAALEIQGKYHSDILTLPCDVRDYVGVSESIDKISQQFGQLDIVVNNAAGNFISPTERLSAHAFEVILDIVLKGTFNVTHTAGKYWINTGKPGTVLNIVTTYAHTGSGYVVPSASAKAGVIAMTRSLAVEWSKYKIRLNGIAPGPFPTDGAWKRLFPEPLAKIMDPINRIPVGRVGHHNELTNLAAYLISDHSAFINGEIITIDGGEWLQGAGQFNGLNSVPGEMWDILENEIRKKK